MKVLGINGDIKGVIFDLDGLLVNSEKLYWQANIQAAKEAKLDIPEDSYLKLTGATAKDMQNFYHKYFATEVERDAFIKRTDDLVWQWTDEGKLKLQKGVRKALDRFKTSDLRMAIASSNYKKVIEHALDKTGIKSYFDFYLSYDDVEKFNLAPKPAGDIYSLAAKKLNLNKQEVIIFEDSSTGIAATKDAGIQGIMIPDLKSPSLKDKENASLICQSFLDFLEKIA
ncbi:HAD family phosphatase [Lactobacillus jensenii]|uniref:HAD family hydrolase n=1 Tax=Lactobacillus jensenii TaxID=109790 RepID=UPI001196D1CB|nr:HAD family phosphatase [Lactobacillus jensenii]MDK7323853.1 HAD family phosphatase [Lactobacillus jensenii]TVV07907.1 HAD family phosphatase [Lactobacillus jensenii]